MRKMRNQKGFTLVEIAIVLVIVGLLIGAILKGQEMIKSAKIKKVVTTADGVRASYNTYLDKTGKEPGYDTATPPVFTDAAFWQDLFDQKITAQAAAASDPFGGSVAIVKYTNTAVGDLPDGLYITFPGVGANAEIMQIIEDKYDDGDETTGAMQVKTSVYYMPM